MAFLKSLTELALVCNFLLLIIYSIYVLQVDFLERGHGNGGYFVQLEDLEVLFTYVRDTTTLAR